ncbi:MAG: RsmE family RNA methyltransferase [bacterium]
MRLHRFYINEKVGEKAGGGEISLTDSDLAHQLKRVFRFQTGDQVIVFDGSGFEYVSEIISLEKDGVVIKILSQSAKTLSNKNVSLYLALIKKGNFELAAEKCTEVGVSEIHPIISERSEKKDLNLERLNKIVKEASEQSGRVTLPEVFEVMDLEEAIKQAVVENRKCLVFHTSDLSFLRKQESGSNSLDPRFREDDRGEKEDGRKEDVAIFIGPEGGWTEKEMELFKKNSFQIHSLGQNILRAETAAIISVWKVLNN